MLLGCKVHPDFYEIEKYQECVKKFDVWYVNSNVYDNLNTLDAIYNNAVLLNKKMYGYYLFSARLFNKNLDTRITLPLIRNYARSLIDRYPLINDWELTHEAFDEKGGIRKNNIFYKQLTVNWQTIIYKQLKRDFPNKQFFYSDFIHNKQKADSIIKFVNQTKEIDGFNFQCHTDILHPISGEFVRYVYKNINKRIVSLENVVWLVGDNDIPPFKLNKVLSKLVKKKVYNLLNINRGISERIQAYRYRQYKNIALKSGIEVFGVWTLSDNFYDMFLIHPWQRDSGLLDRNFNKKPAYNSIFS